MQFLSILAKITLNGHSKAFPVFWVIISNKAEECYLKAFNYLVSQFPTFQPTICLTDHELAMRNAVKKIYPDIINRTCYFHYSQALIKNAKEKKVITSSSSTYSNPELFYVINLLKYLALLPAHCINVTYEAVKEEAKNYFEDLFNDFFDYYEDQWLKKEGPKQFSVFDRMEDRTTNIVESYHSQLNALTRKHPDSNKFLATLIMLLQEERIDLQAMRNGNYEEATKKTRTTENNKEIEEFCNKIKEIMSDGEKAVNLIESIKNLKSMKELEQKEENLIETMITIIEDLPEENDDLMKFQNFVVMTVPDNPKIVLQQVRDIRRKFVASLDSKFILRVFNAPKTL